ncbi:MAG: DUF4102 domain-containing protein [Mesorhizobium sp.]|nr:MAG: DUF4102 domain-containing protein [Mesorhizobium sp.]
MRVRITKRLIERDLPKQVTTETWIWDTEVLAFGIRLRPGRRPTYAMRWKDDTFGGRNGRDRKMNIGPVEQIDLDDARAIARQRFGELAAGDDPAEKQRERKRTGVTVSDLIKEVVETMEAKGRAARYVRDFKQQMRDHVEPTIGSRFLRDVTATEVDRILAKLARRPALHNHVRAGLSSVFTAALRGRYRADNPVMGSTKAEARHRERLLTNSEIDGLLKVLDTNAGQNADAMRLLWLTGSRPQEAFAMRWNDVDLDAGVWTKPAQTVKQRRTHRVTLRAEAVALLKRMLEERGDSPFVFPSDGAKGTRQRGYKAAKTGHLTTIKKFAAKVFEAAGLVDVRPYDLRKAFASRLVASGADLKTVMSLTGHTQVAVLLKHYAHVMDGKQTEALEKAFG